MTSVGGVSAASSSPSVPSSVTSRVVDRSLPELFAADPGRAERYVVHGELEYWAPTGIGVPPEILEEIPQP